ncbi:hypothetical protein HOP50_10g58670 [Chloropicon primus]|uniref:Uncharacterized protein n=1 Tax=Chloropicon primus TaxID=1764295 RepID=A0A5B8MRV7_9CHLO|nr:hypothetical protein A3770_10p58470 [Chloropicon primus]UPR02541.1 hypothetical protein HOP50_10g58670 [Chloropicon primus]|eukprot:QDZ23329.1 hypothetical protein A3770_10p58470 [Chloropicon primus]
MEGHHNGRASVGFVAFRVDFGSSSSASCVGTCFAVGGGDEHVPLLQENLIQVVLDPVGQGFGFQVDCKKSTDEESVCVPSRREVSISVGADPENEGVVSDDFGILTIEEPLLAVTLERKGGSGSAGRSLRSALKEWAAFSIAMLVVRCLRLSR